MMDDEPSVDNAIATIRPGVMEVLVQERPEVLDRVAAALGRVPVDWVRPECGLSAAQRWVTRFADGGSVFVKAATDADTARWLRAERRALAVAGERFAPAVVRWLDDEYLPVLVTEDLSDRYWPAGTGVVRWRPGDQHSVLQALAELGEQSGAGLRTLPVPAARWSEILDSNALVRAGWRTPSWTRAYGPELVSADRMPDSPAVGLVHGDVRSDNLCIAADGRVRFVDWSNAGRGHPDRDLVDLLPTLRLEGGPQPSQVLSKPVELITLRAGGSIARALGERRGPAWLQDVLRALAAISLTWTCEVLGLGLPDGESFPADASAAGPSD